MLKMAEQDALSTYDHIRLTLSSSYYSVRRALRLNLLRDLLTQSSLTTDAPIWVMGQEFALSGTAPQEGQEAVWPYGAVVGRSVMAELVTCQTLVRLAPQILRDMVCCFQSILWMTYRSSFTPLGE